MAPTKSAGRVSIRVLPDSTRFREDLKKTLDRIENTMRVKIQVDPVFDRKQLAELKRQIEALKITIRPDIDLNVPVDDIAKIKEAIESMSPMVEINTKVNTAVAAARIRALGRDQIVNIMPVLHKAAVNNFTKHLAAISGANFITQEIRKGMDFLRTIDQHAVQIAKQATMLGGVLTLANGAIQAIMGLGDGLISTLGILSVAPALASSMGIAIAVFAVALKDMKTVLADLGPAFSQLARDMSFKFWDEAAEPIREMVNHLMPTLSEKMLLASTSMGKLTGQIAKSYKEHVTIEKFSTMFDRVLKSMDTVRGAVDPVMESFTILGMHGTKYLDRLSLSIVGMTEDFRDWLKVSEENGNLEKWTEDAIRAFKDLGGIVKGVWDVFGALNTAMKDAGGPTLRDLHQGIFNLARMMEAPDFQEALTSVFRGMNIALKDIGTAIAGIGPDLAKMAPTIEKAFISIGDTIATLIGYFGEIMAHPAVRGGLTDLFEGINKGVKNLAPAIEPFSVALGSILKLLGTVIENVGALIATIAVEWGPSLQKLSDAFDTLAEPLRIMLEDVVKALTPAIETLIDRAIIPLIEWIRDNLIPAVSTFAREIGPELEWIMGKIGDAIDMLLPWLSKLTDFFTDSEGEASDFRKTLDGIQQFFNDPQQWVLEVKFKAPDISGWWERMLDDAKKEMNNTDTDNLIGDWFIELGKGIGKKIADMWNNVDWAPNMDGKNNLWDGIKEKWDELGGMWDNFWENLGNNDKDWSKMLDEDGLTLATAGIDVDLTTLKERVVTFWQEMTTSGDSSTATMTMNLGLWWAEVKAGFALWWEELSLGWTTFWAGFGETLSIWWTNIKLGFSTWWAEISEGWSTFWTGFGETLNTWWTTITENLQTWWTGITEGLVTWLEGMGINTESGWSVITSGTQVAWEALKTWLGEKWEEIKAFWKLKLEDMGIDTDSGWAAIKSITNLAWESLKSWLGQKWQEIKDGLKQKLSDMGFDVDGGWRNISNITNILWEMIKQAIANKWNEIVNYVPGKLQEFGNHVRNGFESARQAARDKMQELKQGVIDKAQEVVDWIRDLPNKMRNAMTGQSLESSGSSLIQGFKDGMIAKANEAYEAAKGILAKIRNLFPASPAKEGPFSGMGWTPYSGAALVNGFAEGMSSRMSHAVQVAHTMTTGVANELSNVKYNPSEATAQAGHEGSNGNVTVKIYNPIAEPSSRTIARASSMIKLGGSI